MKLKTIAAGAALMCSALVNATNVACVGNSITEGYGIGYDNSYPTRLQEMMGSDTTVTNFGVSSMTFCKSGSQSYWNMTKFTSAMTSNPDMIVIELGTNDSKYFFAGDAANNVYNYNYGAATKTQLEADYRSLIDTFAHLSSKPEIWTTLQPYSNNQSWFITDTAITNVINPIIFDASVEKGVNIIDLHTQFRTSSWYLDDSVHPNIEGAKLLAGIIYKYLTKERPVVSKNGATLSVNNGYKYYWYKDGKLIDEANSQSYTATEKGTYKALVKVDSDNDSYLLTNAIEVTEVSGESQSAEQIDCSMDDTISVTLTDNECAASLNFVQITTTSNLGNQYTATGTRSDGLDLNDEYPIGTTTIDWKFTINNGIVSCKQVIDVKKVDPILDCGTQELNIEITGDSTSVGVELTIPTYVYCEDTIYGVPSRLDNQDMDAPYGLGTTIVNWTFTFKSGTQFVCEQPIIVSKVPTKVDEISNEMECNYKNGVLTLSKAGNLSIYDLQGRLLKTIKVEESSQSISLALEPAVYILTVESEGQNWKNTLVVK